MEEFINSFGRNNFIIVLAVVFAIILSLAIIVLIEKIKEKKQDDLEFYEEDEYIEEEEKKDESIVYAEETTEEDAKKTLENITKKLVEEENNDLIGATSFEMEQEEKSVISYEELIKASHDIDEKNDALLMDEGSEPITIEELYQRHVEQEEKEVLDNPIFIEDSKKFKNSEVISPVFGIYSKQKEIEKKNEEYLEKTMDLEDLELEIRKTEEFLRELKKLKNKLD